MRAFAITCMVLAVLCGLGAFGVRTTDASGEVANIAGEHNQLVLVICFGAFLTCSVIIGAAEGIIDAIRRR